MGAGEEELNPIIINSIQLNQHINLLAEKKIKYTYIDIRSNIRI